MRDEQAVPWYLPSVIVGAPRHAWSPPDAVKAWGSLLAAGQRPMATTRRLLASMPTCVLVEYW